MMMREQAFPAGSVLDMRLDVRNDEAMGVAFDVVLREALGAFEETARRVRAGAVLDDPMAALCERLHARLVKVSQRVRSAA